MAGREQMHAGDEPPIADLADLAGATQESAQVEFNVTHHGQERRPYAPGLQWRDLEASAPTAAMQTLRGRMSLRADADRWQVHAGGEGRNRFRFAGDLRLVADLSRAIGDEGAAQFQRHAIQA